MGSDEKVLVLHGFPAMPTKGSKPAICNLHVPLHATVFSSGRTLELPVRRGVQDPVHLVKKIVNPLCNDKKQLLVNGVRISTAPIVEAIMKDCKVAIVFESELKIRLTDLTRPDRQDFRAAQRLLEPCVLSYLRDYACNNNDELGEDRSAELRALLAYLEFARATLDAYLNPKLSPVERVEKACYALFFAEAWLVHLKERVAAGCIAKAALHFVSSNVLTGLRLNAEFLFVWCCVLARLPAELRAKLPFAVWLFGSQPVEDLFRLLRQMPGYENFDTYDLLKRVNRLQAAVLLKSDGIFHFSGSRKAWNFDALCKEASPFPSTTTEADIRAAAIRGCSQALKEIFRLSGKPDDCQPSAVPTAQCPPAEEKEEELNSDDDDTDAERLDTISEKVLL